jgi:hypothetical protein
MKDAKKEPIKKITLANVCQMGGFGLSLGSQWLSIPTHPPSFVEKEFHVLTCPSHTLIFFLLMHSIWFFYYTRKNSKFSLLP